MTLASVSMAQQPVVPADLFPSFLTYMRDISINMAQQAVLQAQGPCGHIISAACANSGSVAGYERPVALS